MLGDDLRHGLDRIEDARCRLAVDDRHMGDGRVPVQPLVHRLRVNAPVLGPLERLHYAAYLAADLDHPASAGEAIEIYGLGLGVTDPAVEAGVASPSSPPARAVQTPRLQIGGLDAVITFAGLAPGFAGLYQVNAVVPAGLAPGMQDLVWPDGAVSYSAVVVK